MTENEVIDSMAAKLERTGNWRIRQDLGTLTEIMSQEIVPFNLQISERRFRDAADYMLAAYGSAKELLALMDKSFPEISELDET